MDGNQVGIGGHRTGAAFHETDPADGRSPFVPRTQRLRFLARKPFEAKNAFCRDLRLITILSDISKGHPHVSALSHKG